MEGRARRWHRLLSPIALYDDPACTSLATEAAAGRQFRWCGDDYNVAAAAGAATDAAAGGGGGGVAEGVVEVVLREDYYRGWVRRVELLLVDDASPDDDAIVTPAVAGDASSKTVVDGVLEFIIKYAATAPRPPYKWGGTLGGADGFDCSGRVATALPGVRLVTWTVLAVIIWCL
jgi:hypothetical protein